MKNIKSSLICALMLSGSQLAYADGSFTMRVPTSDNMSTSVWVDTSAVLGDWVDVEGSRNCYEWTPPASRVYLGEEFIQSRDCLQLQHQEVTAEQVDKVSGNTRTTTYKNERYVTQSENQDAIGTLEAWVFTTSVFTEWEYTGESGYSDWAPAASPAQTDNYTQKRNLYTYKERYEQLRKMYNATGEIKDVGTPFLKSGYDAEESSRSVAVSVTNWGFVGTYYNCGGWRNVTSGNYYKRAKTCVWKATRQWTHKVNDSTIYTYTQAEIPSGTVYQYVQKYSCPNTSPSNYGFREPWSGCRKM